jgi:hypothetical protein
MAADRGIITAEEKDYLANVLADKLLESLGQYEMMSKPPREL